MLTAPPRLARQAALLLALFAVALRLAAPGWATTVSSDADSGTHTITICTGVGFATISIDEDGRRLEGPTASDTARDLHHDCLSCCMRTVPAVPAVPVTIPFPAATATGVLPIDWNRIAPTASGQAWQARAPPLC